jgi:endonuclease-3
VTRAAYRLSPGRKIVPVLDALRETHGAARWRRREEPLAVLIRGVLSQNTSDVNSGRAFESLMARFGDWEGVARARTRSIAAAIKSGGLADQKAAAIKAVMRWLGERDGYSLGFLGGLETDEAEGLLTAIKGVGIKTARLTLLFGLGRPIFVVDTHVLRVSRRLGLVPPKCTREKAHILLDEIVPDDRKYEGHLNMIAHGRRICIARNPRCGGCPVAGWCLHVRGLGV